MGTEESATNRLRQSLLDCKDDLIRTVQKLQQIESALLKASDDLLRMVLDSNASWAEERQLIDRMAGWADVSKNRSAVARKRKEPLTARKVPAGCSTNKKRGETDDRSS